MQQTNGVQRWSAARPVLGMLTRGVMATKTYDVKIMAKVTLDDDARVVEAEE